LAGRRDEFRASVAAALDYAAVLGARRIHVMAGLADPADPAARAAYEHNIAWAADEAGGRGLQVLIEPINAGDMPGYFLRDFDYAAQILGGLPDGGAGLQFDLYHCQKINGRVLEHLDALLPITAHMQIAGVPDRREPSPATLPLREIFARLAAGGYGGRVGCEYRPAAGTEAGLAWVEALEDALAEGGAPGG
jgi:hydroxypyruvate isomerase